jgi:hypothetical protein
MFSAARSGRCCCCGLGERAVWVLYFQRRLMIRHGLTIAAWDPSLFGRLHTCIGYRNYKKCARDAPGRVWIIRSVMRDVIREATARGSWLPCEVSICSIYFGTSSRARQSHWKSHCVGIYLRTSPLPVKRSIAPLRSCVTGQLITLRSLG